MKKRFVLFIIALLSFVAIPFGANAAKKNDKVTIYLFRGKGCGYCRAFLTFLNDINPEYGKYFELKSYEVWYNEDNYDLMKSVSEFMEQSASGVPYIIIGDKVFAGYASAYDDAIKEKIMELYKTDKSKRYDVFKEYEKKEKLTKTYSSKNFKETLEDESMTIKVAEKNSNGVSSDTKIILYSFAFAAVSTIIIVFFVNFKFKLLERNLNTSLAKVNKTKKN